MPWGFEAFSCEGRPFLCVLGTSCRSLRESGDAFEWCWLVLLHTVALQFSLGAVP